MPLPFSFANVTTLVTSQLDANYAALGALTPIPCTISGSGPITFTPNANTSTTAAYSNYQQFTGIASGTNLGAAQAQVGSLALLNIYKDTPNGPSLLSGGEIVINCQFTIIYDSALNSGNGGFHLSSPANYVRATGGSVSTVSTAMLFTNTVQFSEATVFLAPASLISASLSGLAQFSGGFKAGGATVSRILSTTSSVTWPNIPAASSTLSNVVLAGCSVGDVVTVGTPASIPTGVLFFGWVPNAGSVSLAAYNVTASSITPAADTYRVTANRYA